MRRSNDDANRPAPTAAAADVGALIQAYDWSATPLQSIAAWPQSLRSTVELMVQSGFPMFLAWGPDLRFLYNDAYIGILGTKHPDALGARFEDVWAEVWTSLSPLVDAARRGEATYLENFPLQMNRSGYDERTWFTFSYSPVRDESGQVAGLFCACTETTQTVLAERRREAALTLDERLRDESDTAALSFLASEVLGHALNAVRVGYGVIDAEAGTVCVERNWFAPGFDNLAGVHRFSDYGSYIEDLRRGVAVVIHDVAKDPRTAANADSFRAMGVRANLDIPVVEDGRTVAQLFVHSPVPRNWTDEEVAFVRDFAKRTHAAISLRHAEAELRASEARYRQIVEGAEDVAIVALDLDGVITAWNSGAERVVGYPLQRPSVSRAQSSSRRRTMPPACSPTSCNVPPETGVPSTNAGICAAIVRASGAPD